MEKQSPALVAAPESILPAGLPHFTLRIAIGGVGKTSMIPVEDFAGQCMLRKIPPGAIQSRIQQAIDKGEYTIEEGIE